jgi:ABC-type transport system involved in cytochrome c biogenesis permease component
MADWSVLSGLLVGVYAGLVLLATDVFPLHAPVAVAGSTLIAACHSGSAQGDYGVSGRSGGLIRVAVRELASMIAKTCTPFLGVQPFGIMGFTGNDGAGVGHGLLV